VKRLIVNADDLGLHPGINAGIIGCCREGIVTSVSLSSNGAAFEDAVRSLTSLPALDVGAHLTLVGESPLCDPSSLPTLAPDGRLPGYFTTLFRRLLLRQVRVEEIERELEAQLTRARDAGLNLSHVDSHQHVHLHPVLLTIVLRLAQRFGIPSVRAGRRLLDVRGLRPAMLAVFARRGAIRIRKAKLKTPDLCVGVSETGRLNEVRLLRLIPRIPTGTTELICHPGCGDGAISEAYPWGFRWDEEAGALRSPRVHEALLAAGVSLISYRDL